MSSAYEGKDPLELAAAAEKDLNSRAAKTGHGTSDTSKSHCPTFTYLRLRAPSLFVG